jgi:hypothetical protein
MLPFKSERPKAPVNPIGYGVTASVSCFSDWFQCARFPRRSLESRGRLEGLRLMSALPARIRACTQRTDEGLPVDRRRSLASDLATVTRKAVAMERQPDGWHTFVVTPIEYCHSRRGETGERSWPEPE